MKKSPQEEIEGNQRKERQKEMKAKGAGKLILSVLFVFFLIAILVTLYLTTRYSTDTFKINF